MTRPTTTARGSRSRSAVIALLLAASIAAPDAHRLDELLQAVRISVEPDHVDLTIDLTPGIAVAGQVLKEIDADGDGAISDAEGQAYAGRVLQASAIDVDGRAVTVSFVSTTAPATTDLLAGRGTVTIHARAPLSAIAAGAHTLTYRNGWQPQISVYLANALVPESQRVAVTGQRRNDTQRDLAIAYVLGAPPPARGRLVAAGSVAGLCLLALLLWTRRSRAIASREAGPRVRG